MKEETKTDTLENEVSETLTSEIKEAVVEATIEVKESQPKKEDSEKTIEDPQPSNNDHSDDATPEGDASGEEEGSTEKAEDVDDDKNSVTDELIERAVKLGIPLKDVKVAKASLLTHVCDQMEAVNKAEVVTGDKEDPKVSADKEIEDALSALPEIDEDVFDEIIVNFAKGTKSLIGKLLKDNQELKALNSQGKQQSFFDTKVAGLDEPLAKALKDAPAKRGMLSKKFSVLEAGYKVTGEKVDANSIFEEAVAMTLSDVKAEATIAGKEEKLKSRSKQIVSRPGTTKKESVSSDPTEMAVAALNKKFSTINKS